MIGNQVIMKTYKEIKNKTTKINFEKEYEDDNYLIQTLKRTIKCKTDKKILDFEENIKNLLSYIYKKIQLQEDPNIKKIKLENDDFQKEYHSISENFQKTSKSIFKDLIRQYNLRGYKLPNFTYEHNLFKINALIEENNDKLELILREDKKNKDKNKNKDKKESKALKTMNYLKKLNFLLNLLLSKDENTTKKIARFSKPKIEINAKKKQSIIELKENIEKLKLFIKNSEVMNNERKRNEKMFRRKTSFLSSQNVKSFKLIKPLVSSDEYSGLNANIINKTQTESGGPGTSSGAGEKKSDPINIIPVRQESNKSVYSNLSVNSLKEVKSIENKIGQEDTLYSTPFDNNKHYFTKTSKQLMKLRGINVNINNTKENIKNEINPINNKTINLEENVITPINIKTRYSNTFSNYKNNQINTFNSKNLNTNPKKLRISLKKNFNPNNDYYANKRSYNIKTSKNLNIFFLKTFSNLKTPKNKTTFFVKTQTLDKRNKSRNNNIFLNTNSNTIKYDLNLKTQNNFFNTHFKTQDDYLNNAYKRLKKGNYDNLEKLIRKYLKDIKHLEQDEEDFMISHYNYKNLKSNLVELSTQIEKKDTGKKTERIYFSNHLAKRVIPLLKSMKEKENNINRFEKVISSGVNKYK